MIDTFCPNLALFAALSSEISVSASSWGSINLDPQSLVQSLDAN
ncbi:MAG: hypothetical protein AB8U91_00175 [Candidatus Midichloria sp.]